jgi:DNA invertase Pin-like site-specific DNA recombinase
VSPKYKPHVPVTRRRGPVAFSYLRYSDPKQRKGDTVRRQTEARNRWLQDHPDVPLDTSLKLADRAKSGFRRKDWDSYALARFVKEIDAGRVLPGDYLLVENLDRLSREVAGEAVELFLRIVNAGVIVVQLMPRPLEFRKPVDAMMLMFAVVELSRGHSESAAKSFRSQANWDKALRLARDERRPMTGRLPAWVERTENGLALVPGRAAVVRRIFELATAGLGVTSIVKRLSAEKVPAFGARELDEPDEGGGVHHRKVDGQPFGCGEWRTSYVLSILSDRRAIGELQPCDRDGKPKGAPLERYYPPVVTREEFYRARAAVLGRRNRGAANRQGRIGEGVPNLFSGLLKNARDGESYYAGVRKDRGAWSRVLRCRSGVEGRGANHTFPYPAFERALLSHLREPGTAEVFGGPAGQTPAELTVLQGDLDWVRDRRARLAALLQGDDDVQELVEELRRLKDRETELTAGLDDAERRAAKPLAETWDDVRSLAEALDEVPAEGLEEARLRLRSALRRAITEIRLLVVKGTGRVKSCYVQAVFPTSQTREYLILVVPGYRGKAKGWYAAINLPYRDHRPDLTDPDQVVRIEKAIAGLPPWTGRRTDDAAILVSMDRAAAALVPAENEAPTYLVFVASGYPDPRIKAEASEGFYYRWWVFPTEGVPWPRE